ncbi:MAG: glycosyltransferase family 4 protein, partial [Gillisia sp.]
PSLHFFRWVDQLKDADFEVFWFDVTGAGNFIDRISWVHQITDWKLRWDFPGRTFLKKKKPGLYNRIEKLNERNTGKIFERELKRIKPDIVHSFALYVSCTPIISVMEKYPGLKWILSTWGSDLFYFQNSNRYLKDIQRVLPRIDFLFTDCRRDYELAKKYGFQGKFLGVFPGGGGYDLEKMNSLKIPFEERSLILIKGYQGRSGRAIPVLEAVGYLREELKCYKIVIFGADKETKDYVEENSFRAWPNIEVQGKIPQEQLWELMGQAKVYVGNSNSDGIPNTLLEALCLDAFPVQSNPGRVTEEIIQHRVNGILIGDCEDRTEIMEAIKEALNTVSLSTGLSANSEFKQSLDYDGLRRRVISRYTQALGISTDNKKFMPDD